ncbi:GPR1/FUN34/YaaH family transporter [Pseudonocardia sp. RS11V-5]|uniref:acetate uptake transporter family protein n=1 Tax=Pseudonocardia terrae TaxID=2905831 RepID=UPI001E457B4C|nr:GPR1/FUN34/YaaH family transporter [Pseudonocardia terrae]MCE3556176.1 GPR1/FUN34/YaaH family transporter [Pseudonocardia terrae]
MGIPEQRTPSDPLANQSSGGGLDGHSGSADGPADQNSREAWFERSRLVVTPVAAPSILGLFGFAGATFMVASLLAGWWGSPLVAAPVLAPFVFFFGGLAQLLAGMWAYKARDGVATAMHGTWGAFWLAWGALVWAVSVGALPVTALVSQAFGFWFIVLALVTLFGALASLGENLGMFTVLGLLTAGSVLLAIGFIGGYTGAVTAGGWVLVASAAAAFYTAGAMMMAGSFRGRTILPLGRYSTAANIPGRRAIAPIGYPEGLPGARVGQ